MWPSSSIRLAGLYLKSHCDTWEAAARTFGLQIQVLNADTGREIDAAFDSVGSERPDATSSRLPRSSSPDQSFCTQRRKNRVTPVASPPGLLRLFLCVPASLLLPSIRSGFLLWLFGSGLARRPNPI